ncbi:protein artichoke-like [Coccinella septempunctata]|uniref:protein artichoke-like n=1 Tax=Coccinella septempunctata TaxID=41139 RepID=UPI001D07B5A6|nr:protein artichoke-like [Coccinella septempunctata]
MWPLYIFLIVCGLAQATEVDREICNTENWTELNLKIIQDEDDIKRITSNKCAIILRYPPSGMLTKNILDLLPRQSLKILQVTGQLRVLDDDSFSSLRYLKYLKLSEVDFANSDMLSGDGRFTKNIESLDLSKNGLTNLDFFKTESKKLKKLNLDRNTLQTVPNDLKVFDNLEELSMSNNKIRNISLVYSLIDVEYLDLSHNYIRNASGLEYFPNLEVLNLTNNNIDELRVEYFGIDRSNMRELLLDHNAIEFIGVRLLMNFRNLKTFSISKNRLRKLIPTTDAYRDTELETLNLGENHLDEIPYNFLKWFPFLKTLKINNNKLSYLRPGTFSNLNNLEVLDLSNNEIVNFDVRRLLPLESLSILNISSNKIEQIDYFSLVLHLPTLKSIRMDGNSLFCENLIEMLSYLKINDVQVEDGECEGSAHIKGICCEDSTKNYTENKFNMAAFSMMKQNEKNVEKLDELLETLKNITSRRVGSSSVQEESVVITKATFWTGLGVVIIALILILLVLVVTLITKKKEILPVHL